MKYVILPIWLIIVICVRLFIVILYTLYHIFVVLLMILWNFKFKTQWVVDIYNKGLDDFRDDGSFIFKYKRPTSYWDYIINGLQKDEN